MLAFLAGAADEARAQPACVPLQTVPDEALVGRIVTGWVARRAATDASLSTDACLEREFQRRQAVCAGLPPAAAEDADALRSAFGSLDERLAIIERLATDSLPQPSPSPGFRATPRLTAAERPVVLETALLGVIRRDGRPCDTPTAAQ